MVLQLLLAAETERNRGFYMNFMYSFESQTYDPSKSAFACLAPYLLNSAASPSKAHHPTFFPLGVGGEIRHCVALTEVVEGKLYLTALTSRPVQWVPRPPPPTAPSGVRVGPAACHLLALFGGPPLNSFHFHPLPFTTLHSLGIPQPRSAMYSPEAAVAANTL